MLGWTCPQAFTPAPATWNRKIEPRPLWTSSPYPKNSNLLYKAIQTAQKVLTFSLWVNVNVVTRPIMEGLQYATLTTRHTGCAL